MFKKNQMKIYNFAIQKKKKSPCYIVKWNGPDFSCAKSLAVKHSNLANNKESHDLTRLVT